MGTNYYAHWRPPGAENVTLVLHICKSYRNFNGSTFPTWQAWKVFLEHNAYRTERVTVIDEYDVEIPIGDFVHAVEGTGLEDRRRQHDWMVENGCLMSADWLDDDGFSFHDGEFS